MQFACWIIQGKNTDTLINIQYLQLFQGNNAYMNAPQRYTICTDHLVVMNMMMSLEVVFKFNCHHTIITWIPCKCVWWNTSSATYLTTTNGATMRLHQNDLRDTICNSGNHTQKRIIMLDSGADHLFWHAPTRHGVTDWYGCNAKHIITLSLPRLIKYEMLHIHRWMKLFSC
jgi:hypothetical protein